MVQDFFPALHAMKAGPDERYFFSVGIFSPCNNFFPRNQSARYFFPKSPIPPSLQMSYGRKLNRGI